LLLNLDAARVPSLLHEFTFFAPGYPSTILPGILTSEAMNVARQFRGITFVAVILCLATLGFALGASAAGNRQSLAPQDEKPTIRFVRNPDPAPDFKLTTLEGKPLSLADAHGKVILLNFWASWCGPCRAEIPDLIELQKRYRDRLAIIGLVVDDEDAEEIRKVVEAEGINYLVALASDEVRMQYGGIAALPTSFMLDAQGRVVQKHIGLRNPALYETEIRALLGLPIDANVETFEDTGEIFLKHADRASELPGVDLSQLTPRQKTVALHRFNAEACTCGCPYTLAQCRVWDHNCPISKERTAQIVAEVAQQSIKARPISAEPGKKP